MTSEEMQCVVGMMTERRGSKNEDGTVERKEDDTNGFWGWCIQLLRNT